MKGSKIFGGAIASLAGALALPFGRKKGAKIRAYAAERLVPIYPLPTPVGKLYFACPTRSAARMPLSFFHLEPETVGWLDQLIMPGQCLWDIGANIGHFSLYAAFVRQADVLAFEPSAQTFGVLYRNIALNGLSERIKAYCVALANETRLGSFYVRNPEAGEALHAYGAPVNLRGEFAPGLEQATIAFTVDEFITRLGARPPDHIKLDVDGYEQQILRGADKTLGSVRSVMVEIDNAVLDQRNAESTIALLGASGLEEDRNLCSPSGWNRLFRRWPHGAGQLHGTTLSAT